MSCKDTNVWESKSPAFKKTSACTHSEREREREGGREGGREGDTHTHTQIHRSGHKGGKKAAGRTLWVEVSHGECVSEVERSGLGQLVRLLHVAALKLIVQRRIKCGNHFLFSRATNVQVFVCTCVFVSVRVSVCLCLCARACMCMKEIMNEHT